MTKKIIIADDSFMIRQVLKKMLENHAEVLVVGEAVNGKEALTKIDETAPDVLILDLEMPEMDGMQTLEELKKRPRRPAVIVFSAFNMEGAEKTIECLAKGAQDFVTKPSSGSITESMQTIEEELLPKIINLGTVSNGDAAPHQTGQPPSPLLKAHGHAVLVGISTGGPAALMEVIPRLPVNFPAPILIVQHMPPLFTQSLAHRLDQISKISVKEAEDQEFVRPGSAYIAPGGTHMKVRSGSPFPRIILDDGPPVNSCKPAADVLFKSAALIWSKNVHCLIMTGMGQDGLEGAKLLKTQGARIIAQSKESCVVAGMPGAIIDAGIADHIIPLNELAGFIAGT